LVAATPVQLTAGTLNCAATKRKVRVPWEAAKPAQLSDSRLVMARVRTEAVGRMPPITLTGVPGRMWFSREAAGLGLAAAAGGAPPRTLGCPAPARRPRCRPILRRHGKCCA